MIAVTGGTGLLGSHLLFELIRQKHCVKALIRKDGDPKKVLSVWKHHTGQPESLLKKVTWLPTDLNNKSELFKALENVDRLFHCAGVISFNPGDKDEMFRVNVEATGNIVDTCLESGKIKLIHVSSIAAIGESDEELIKEESGWPVNSMSIYSKTKTLGELEVWRGIEEGLDAVIINPSVILGSGFWKDSSSRFFHLIYNGLNYYTLGQTGFVDVRNVVDSMIMLMRSEITGERYIVNAENLSYRSLFSKISGAFKMKPPRKYANPLKTSIAWRAELVKYLITGKDPRVTKQTAGTSHKIQNYSSEKIRQHAGIKFSTIDDTIHRIAGDYLTDIGSKSQN